MVEKILGLLFSFLEGNWRTVKWISSFTEQPPRKTKIFIEKSSEKLPFIDILPDKEGRNLHTDIFYKETDAYQCSIYISNPVIQKI